MMKKILLLIMFMFLFLNVQTISVYADGDLVGPPAPAAGSTSDSYGDGVIDEWWTPDDTQIKKSPVQKSMNIMGAALNITQIIAIGIIIIMGMVLGCKFMISSVEDRAEIKKHLMAYFIGTIIVLCALAIVNIIKTFATSLDSSTES